MIVFDGKRSIALHISTADRALSVRAADELEPIPYGTDTRTTADLLYRGNVVRMRADVAELHAVHALLVRCHYVGVR